MKRNFLIMLLATLTLMYGCGQKESQPLEQNAVEETAVETDETEATREEATEVANPWVDSNEEDIFNELGLSMFAPVDAKDVSYKMNESELMGQMIFKYGEPELEYIYRVKKVNELEDISGLNYEWDVVDSQDIGWCEGECRRAITDSETVDLCMWFDKDIKTMYSLSTSASDLDGYDITAVVYQLFIPEDESEIFMPSNFLEEKLQKDEFESFDEIISNLEKGNAYAIVKVNGLDDEVLFIAEGAYDNLDGNMAAIDASVYRNDNGKVKNIGNVYSAGTAYPISLDKDGRIYSGGNHEVDISVISEETQAIMTQVCAYETFDENGNATNGGFVRDNNKVYEDGVEIAEDDPSVLARCYEEYGETKPVNYTVVE